MVSYCSLLYIFYYANIVSSRLAYIKTFSLSLYQYNSISCNVLFLSLSHNHNTKHRVIGRSERENPHLRKNVRGRGVFFYVQSLMVRFQHWYMYMRFYSDFVWARVSTSFLYLIHTTNPK